MLLIWQMLNVQRQTSLAVPEETVLASFQIEQDHVTVTNFVLPIMTVAMITLISV